MVRSPGVQLAGQTSSVGFHVLERLKHTQGFLHVASHRQVVDGGVLDHTLRVDDEQTAQGNAFGFVEDVVGASNLLLEVSNQGIGDITKALVISPIPWLLTSRRRLLAPTTSSTKPKALPCAVCSSSTLRVWSSTPPSTTCRWDATWRKPCVCFRRSSTWKPTDEVCPANWTPGERTMNPDLVGSKDFFAAVN